MKKKKKFVSLHLFYPYVDIVQDTDTVVQDTVASKPVANFWQKSFKKKIEEEKMNLQFQDKRTRKETWMRAGALRQTIFFV